MELDDVAARGLVLLGCGRMGTALLRGWLAGGLPATAVHVLEPRPSDWLSGCGVAVNAPMPEAPAVAVIAVKPQVMDEALPTLSRLGGGRTLILSIAAGTPLASFEARLGTGTPVIRAMPNTPAAVGCGISALIGNAAATDRHLALAERLMAAVGEVVRLGSEAQMDAVTAVSGSGPAYVFHLIEALAAAAEAEGLPPDLALRLARATVAGAGTLARQTGEDPARLRRDVTSPGGTTQAGLEVLMAELPDLMRRTVAAAAARSRELGRA
ncbi:pyrroline-5-carboxylate reductase [Rubellimicrobium thermophilum DSM 16684]|uniref:Pyrroline-5-carboxylate reductase n=1 Tax=Rubellimicrobium thermophilum DSM 16684 TaxID=1123069 RepID=S9QR06_9RHOB|nr:pyrroline-5-carboxylate reductase [Rubellimicrobium thermophilum]EPX83836.1 pyrroline-5-carboxylate reductase [Rubellimicrobium thermophilum DSM 16684]